MQRDVLELRRGRDVLLVARRGALRNTPMTAGKQRCSLSALDRFLSVQTNVDQLRRRWSTLQPSPALAWYSDADLKRMLKTRVDSGRIDIVLVATGDSYERVDIRPFVEKARKAAADREAAGSDRLQGRSQAYTTSQGSQSVRPASGPIITWSLEQRVEEVARRAGRKVPGEAGHALKELVSPEAIGLMVGLITVGAIAQLTPFGWVADGAIIGVALVFGGLAAVHALGDIIECFDLIRNAKSDSDLERASEALSRAIVAVGLVVLIALLHRFAKGSEKSGNAAKAEAKLAQTEAQKMEAVRTAKPMEKVKPVETKPVEKAKLQEPPKQGEAAKAEAVSDDIASKPIKSKRFKPKGVDRKTAAEFLSSPEGVEYLKALKDADPSASNYTILRRAMEHVTSFEEIPKLVEVSEPLVRIIPKGSTENGFSPYFTTREGLKEARASGKTLSEYFGLPTKSEALEYNVVEIAPVGPQKVLVGRVAPTAEGAVEKSGGALQTLVPNRQPAKWSNPVQVDTIGN